MARASRKPRRKPSTARTRQPKTASTAKRDPLYDFIEAGARSLNLKIDKAWLPAIAAHLRVAWRHGMVVEGFDLPDETEPAPVFQP
jgi:hypothetical protein